MQRSLGSANVLLQVRSLLEGLQYNRKYFLFRTRILLRKTVKREFPKTRTAIRELFSYAYIRGEVSEKHSEK